MKTGHLVLLTLLGWALPFAAGDGTIWIEGESAARHNFPAPADNPFRPVAFWESDLLSGGDWIGMLWKEGDDPRFLEYDFEVPEDGAYSLYARKFFGFGNFRWRVDGGEWVEPPEKFLHSPLHTVAMRGAGERISLSWFYMGGMDLKAGRHTLRVEPVRGAVPAKTSAGPGTPLAYDAFVLTRGLFFPAGKLKPGENHPVRDGAAFAFQPGLDAFDAEALDLRGLNEPTAGSRGGITVRDGLLAFRDNGEPVRMVGVNFDLGRFVSPEAYDYMARSLAKRGVNFVRMDIRTAVEFSREKDGPLRVKFHEPVLGQIARLAGDLKKQGIYTALTWNFEEARGMRALFDPTYVAPEAAAGRDALPVHDNTPRPGYPGLRIFDAEVREAYWKVWERVLGLKLEEGSTLGTDPALFLVTLSQQSSLLEENSLPWSAMPPAAWKKMREDWRAWVGHRHGSVEKALAAWGMESAPDAGPGDVPEVRSILEKRDARSRDALRFLAGVQREDYAALVKRLRGLGYKGLVSASNKSVGHPELLGFAEIFSREPGDVIERHGKLVSDFAPKYDIWNFTEGALYGERSIVRLDPLQGLESARYDLPFKAPGFEGRPSLLTETGVALPNRFSGEMPLAAFMLAALQNVQALGFSTLFSESWHGSHTAARLQIATPAILGQMPALAFAYRRGLLPGPVRTGRVELTDDSIFSLKPLPFAEAPDTQINAPQRPPEKSDSGPDPALWLTGKIEVALDAVKDTFEAAGPVPIGSDGRIEAAGGAVRWEPERRLLVIDAPSFQAASGALRDASPIRLGSIEVESRLETGTVCVVALDGQPVDFSRRMLVQVFSEESNAGYNAQQVGNLSVVRSTGRPPLLVKAIEGGITFLRPDADELFSTALDANGNPLLPAGLGPALRFLPSTMYYLVEK